MRRVIQFGQAAAACVLMVAGLAQGQYIYLDPIDPGTEDVNPLRTSLKPSRADLRVPTDFERVYRVTGDTRAFGGTGEEMYARVSNGLVAMFPKSTYASISRRPTVPPGTIWVLGASARMGIAPAETVATPGAVMPVDNRVDRAVGNAAQLQERIEARTERPPPRRAVPVDVPCIFESENVRQQRMSVRLDEALALSR